ncbi:hypothetical protein KCG44_06545 [Pacificimonas sp. WHA3]|uniref:DUF4350 domain-containing protein n=1 Tax=Pacificimonas pallii TaxID=2827236 RepID=A0ABS6SEC8_9SPHN|nr:hypothetical protein [Pacificimonas pallii]MBV7256443.1 hypothetical protein [Pacificimonas pallii]
MSSAANPFRTRTVLIMVTLGTFAFLAFLVLYAFSDELQSGEDGDAHALSVSGTGYRAMVEIIERTRGDVRMERRPAGDDAPHLHIFTPRAFTDAELLAERARRYAQSGTVLIILPKWHTRSMQDRPQWAESLGRINPAALSAMLADFGDFTIENARDAKGETSGTYNGFRTISGDGLEPFLQDSTEALVGAWLPNENIAIVADADLFNNLAMADLARAEMMLDAIDAALPDANSEVVFDLTLNGFEIGESALKRVLRPPLLGVTLSALLAAILAGVAAAVRFGPMRLAERSVAFGKQALLDNSADMIRLTRREEASATQYIDVIRRQAARRVGLPATAHRQDIDRQLDCLGDGNSRFTALTGALYAARTRPEIVSAAKALHRWKEESFS